MNRWSWLAVVAMAVAMPALAQSDRAREWERSRGREFREQPVVVEKRRLTWMLNRIDGRMSELVGKSRGMDRRLVQALKDLRDDINDVRDTIAAAPDLNGPMPQGQPLPPGPPQPQPPVYQPAPPQAPPVYQPPPQPPPGQPMVYPISEVNFQNLLRAMQRESFANDRMRVLEQAAPNNWFLVAQALQVMAQFDFPSARLQAVRVLKPRLLDTNNFYNLYGAFEFPHDKEELKRILGQ